MGIGWGAWMASYGVLELDLWRLAIFFVLLKYFFFFSVLLNRPYGDFLILVLGL